MINIALRVFWANNPMPIHKKVKTPNIALDIPFGNVLVLNNGGAVTSVNGKNGDVHLNAIDIGADSVGAAKNVFDELFPKFEIVQALAEINQLNISKKADQLELETINQQVELNRLTLLNKADLTALAMLTSLINTKADQVYVQEQIANLVNGDQSIINAIQEISTALKENEDLLEALDYTVANRVRFDIATQALTSLQKHNARTNIGAEEVGTATLLIAQITTQSIGAATALQGKKADTALQSGDVAPVALSGQFTSLGGQNRIYDVIHSAYVLGTNSAIVANDALGVMLGKLQAQINSKAIEPIWVKASQVGTIDSNFLPYVIDSGNRMDLEFAKIAGLLWIRGAFTIGSAQYFAGASTGYKTNPLITFNHEYKMQSLNLGGAMGNNLTVTANTFHNNAIVRMLFWSDRVSMNNIQAQLAVQTFVSASELYAYKTGFLAPTPLGVLIT